MSAPDLSRLDQSIWYFRLPVTNKQVGLWNVTHDGSNRFWYGGQEVTGQLTRAQKGAFPDYDPTSDNLAGYAARNVELGRAANPGGSTSTWGLFVEGVAKSIDPANPGSVLAWLKPVLIVGGFALGAFFVWQIAKATGFKFK